MGRGLPSEGPVKNSGTVAEDTVIEVPLLKVFVASGSCRMAPTNSSAALE